MPPVRSCCVTTRDSSGVVHQVQIQASSLFEAAAAALTAFRQESWCEDGLPPNATLRVEVQLPAVVHEVPLRALERWMRSPSPSPKEATLKQQASAAVNVRRK